MMHSAATFFFLMLPRPPRSTLFPYRRSSDLSRARPRRAVLHLGLVGFRVGGKRLEIVRGQRLSSHQHDRLFDDQRSEEHTSELQSPDHLVCRLLLEKKKAVSSSLLQRAPSAG